MHYKELLDEIRKVILKHASPVRIYLYGSRATGDAGETSDIDIAYDDKECKGRHLIEEEIRNLPALVKIDVKNIAFTEERFRNRVIATGKVLFSSTKKLRFEDGLSGIIADVKREIKKLTKQSIRGCKKLAMAAMI